MQFQGSREFRVAQMNERIRHLVEQMRALEQELEAALEERETRVLFSLKGKQVEFEQSIREAHRKLKTGIYRWLIESRPQNMITLPLIYGMIVPLAFLDLCLALYQGICFPLYRIARVRRSNYIVFDRQHLGYLNAIEKFHCTYCAYANGLMAYAVEITARTEQYWCPIKHARKALGTHARYRDFLDYGDAPGYREKLGAMRAALERGERPSSPDSIKSGNSP